MDKQSQIQKSQTQELIDHYKLVPHQQGGYYRELYRSTFKYDEHRKTMTSIYYMVESSAPQSVWHINNSDIIHFHLRGGSLADDLIDSEGNHERHILGQDFKNGQSHQLLVRSGVIKGTTLINGQYGLLGEDVTPGFQWQDNHVFTQQQMCMKFPHLTEVIKRTQLRKLRQKYAESLLEKEKSQHTNLAQKQSV